MNEEMVEDAETDLGVEEIDEEMIDPEDDMGDFPEEDDGGVFGL